MTIKLEDYLSGNYQNAWTEICKVGMLSKSSSHQETALLVANEIMKRVASNVDNIIDKLIRNSWNFAYPAFVHTLPTQQDLEAIEEMESIVGVMPLALKSCLSIVGGVNFCGSHSSFPVPTYLFGDSQVAILADPLVLPTASWLLTEINEVLSEGSNIDDGVTFAPDEFHKANYSGGSQYINFHDFIIDPVIYNIQKRPNIYFVDYLRTSISWGGFPGFEFFEDIPPLIRLLQEELLPF